MQKICFLLFYVFLHLMHRINEYMLMPLFTIGTRYTTVGCKNLKYPGYPERFWISTISWNSAHFCSFGVTRCTTPIFVSSNFRPSSTFLNRFLAITNSQKYVDRWKWWKWHVFMLFIILYIFYFYFEHVYKFNGIFPKESKNRTHMLSINARR